MLRIPVFLDTSVLPRDPARLGPFFKRLCELAQNDLVKVYFSELVVKEWASQLHEELSKQVKKIRSALKHPWIGEILGTGFASIEKDNLAENTSNDTQRIIEREVERFIQQMQADVLAICDHHGRIVIEDYFRGMPPFSNPKNREDIPDAFIFQCAKDLICQLGCKVHCIVRDKELGKALSQLEDTIIYESIWGFLGSDCVSRALSTQPPEKTWRLFSEQVLKCLPLLYDYLATELKQLSADELAYSYISHSSIPDDNQLALITSVEEPTTVEFNWDDVEDLGASLIALPFSFQCDVEVEFSVYRADAFSVPDGVWINYRDPEEYHYFEAGGSLSLSVIGIMSLYVNVERLGLNDKITALENANIEANIETIEDKYVIEYNNGLIFTKSQFPHNVD